MLDDGGQHVEEGHGLRGTTEKGVTFDVGEDGKEAFWRSGYEWAVDTLHMRFMHLD